jgi:hypothetical protein
MIKLTLILGGLAMVAAFIYGASGYYVAPAPAAAPTAAETAKADADKALGLRAGEGAASLYKLARNPDSIIIDEAAAMKNGSICFTYRGENGFGGTTKELAVMLPGIHKALPVTIAQWNKHCTGDWTDETQNARNMMKAFAQ